MPIGATTVTVTAAVLLDLWVLLMGYSVGCNWVIAFGYTQVKGSITKSYNCAREKVLANRLMLMACNNY